MLTENCLCQHQQRWNCYLVFQCTQIIKLKGSYAHLQACLLYTSTITFGIGPAGTGKTFLAVALAAFYLKNRNVDKIILTRPAVEAGERLGFLPGELQDKVDPYLRPLYDALHEMFGIEQVQRFMERGTIEVAPLAYMRGRTSVSYTHLVTNILDESTTLIYSGDVESVVVNAFGKDVKDNAVFLPNTMSRKKQIVPPILGAMK